MKQIAALVVTLALVGGAVSSVYAHCGKCGKGKSADELMSGAGSAQKMGSCCKDKNTSGTMQFGK
ncbi:MAG: hypothetical protein ACPL7D_07010 [Candidatus Sumerlaeaceae bacterium]|jgi:hypothetical protein